VDVGGVLGQPLVQNKESYFEIKIQQDGILGGMFPLEILY
jgi:hypothetical protein